MLDFSITQDSWPDSQQQFNINTKNFVTCNYINQMAPHQLLQHRSTVSIIPKQTNQLKGTKVLHF